MMKFNKNLKQVLKTVENLKVFYKDVFMVASIMDNGGNKFIRSR